MRRSRSLPDLPTNGRPCASSSAPGPSPTNIRSASGLPMPNTTVVRPAARAQRVQDVAPRAARPQRAPGWRPVTSRGGAEATRLHALRPAPAAHGRAGPGPDRPRLEPARGGRLARRVALVGARPHRRIADGEVVDHGAD